MCRLSFPPPAIEPCCPALFRSPIFTFTFDPHNLQSIEARSDPFDHYRAIDVAHDMAIRLKLPFPAAMNREDEPARLPPHDALHRMKRAYRHWYVWRCIATSRCSPSVTSIRKWRRSGKTNCHRLSVDRLATPRSMSQRWIFGNVLRGICACCGRKRVGRRNRSRTRQVYTAPISAILSAARATQRLPWWTS